MTPLAQRRLIRGLALAALVVVTYLLWDSPIAFLTYPVKLLVVFVHECGHAIAAVLTGGEVASVRVHDNLSGDVVTIGGLPFVILQAGYLAGAIFGAALIVAAADAANARNTLRVIAVGVAACSLAFAWRSVFTLIFAILIAGALWWVAMDGKEPFVRGVLVYLATCSAMYALIDLKEDLLHLQATRPNDAVRLAARTGVPAIVWGVSWAIAALVIMGAAVRKALR